MPRSAMKLAMLCCVATLALSCKNGPPKQPEPEPGQSTQVSEPEPPPPPPKCEALAEACKAEADTRVPIGASGLSFQAPEGWTYAKLESSAVAIADGGVAGIHFRTVAEPLDPKKKPEGVAEALTPMLEQLKIAGVDEKAVKQRLRKPAVQEEAGSLTLNTWDFTGTVNDQEGMVLVIVTTTPSGGFVIGGVAMRKDAVEKYGQTARDAYLSLRSEQ